MLLLHTGDWHAGLRLARQSLDPGLSHALDRMADFSVAEKVDAVLVAGDVFHARRPPAESQELVYQFLLRLYQHDIPVVLIAGNHDSLGHWDALRPLFALANVHVVSRLSTQGCLTVPTRSGPLQIAAVPWPTERLLAPLINEQSWDHDAQKMRWADRVGRVIELLVEKLPEEGPKVLLGHLMVNGSLTSTSERPLSISDTYAVPGEVFPPDLNYVALGHVHKPQTLACPAKARYCGAPRQMNFGEAGEERGFTTVVVEPGRHTATEFVNVEPALPLEVVRTPLKQLETVLQSYREHPGYLKVEVELEHPEPALAERVRRELPQALIVQSRLPGGADLERRDTSRSLLDPMLTFSEYYQEKLGGEELPDDLKAAFLEVLEEVDR